ncbi:TPA: glycosyltransferase family 2 protein [Escherichia coli]
MIAEVSIIMPMYNAEHYVRASICSILNQTFKNFLLYIIDDCSTDSSKQIAESFNDPRIIIISNAINVGVARTRNKGIELAQTKYIAFCDSDDIWHEQKLEKQISLLDSGKYNVVGSFYSTFKDGKFESAKLISAPELVFYRDMLKSNWIGNLTGIYNAYVLGKVFQQEIGHEDYVMWLKLIEKSRVAYIIQEPLAYYRIRSLSLSSNKMKACLWQWRIYRKILHFNIFRTSCYMFFYIIAALNKRR